MFETVLGLQLLKVEDNLCEMDGGDNCVPGNGKCADRMLLDEDKVVPITTDVTSFVSPQHRHVKECVCKPGFAGTETLFLQKEVLNPKVERFELIRDTQLNIFMKRPFRM